MSTEMSECVSMLVCWHFNFTIVILCTLPHIYNPPLPHTKATTHPLSHTHTHMKFWNFLSPPPWHEHAWECKCRPVPCVRFCLSRWWCQWQCTLRRPAPPPKKTQTSSRDERYYPPLKKEKYITWVFPKSKNHCVVTAFSLSFSTLYCVQHN